MSEKGKKISTTEQEKEMEIEAEQTEMEKDVILEEKNIEENAYAQKMIIVKRGIQDRVAIIEDELLDTCRVRWFGNTVDTSLPRNRWKFVEAWQTKDGKHVVQAKPNENDIPAISEIEKTDIVEQFDSLSRQKTIPHDILKRIDKLSLV